MADLDLDKLEADAKDRRDEVARIMRSCGTGEEAIAYATRAETAFLALIERLRAAEAKVAAALNEIGDVSDLDPQQGGCEGARDETLLAIHAALTGKSDDLTRMIATTGVISTTYEAMSSTSMSDILTRLQRAEAKVEDVRKMHWRAKRSDGSLYAFCEGCQEYWPCPTVKVLGEES